VVADSFIHKWLRAVMAVLCSLNQALLLFLLLQVVGCPAVSSCRDAVAFCFGTRWAGVLQDKMMFSNVKYLCATHRFK
jgi:hypothetical protein